MSTLTIEQAFQIAVQHHQAGRLSQAEQLYRQILAQMPNHPDALHLLGVVAHQAGLELHFRTALPEGLPLPSLQQPSDEEEEE